MGCTDRQTTRKHNSFNTLYGNRGIKKSLTFFGISSLGRGLDSESRSFFPSLVELPGGWELIPFTISGMGETNGNSTLLLELESFLSLEPGLLSFCSLLALLDLAWWLLILWLEYVSVTRPLAWRTVLESEFVVALPLLAEFDEGRELLGLEEVVGNDGGRSDFEDWLLLDVLDCVLLASPPPPEGGGFVLPPEELSFDRFGALSLFLSCEEGRCALFVDDDDDEVVDDDDDADVGGAGPDSRFAPLEDEAPAGACLGWWGRFCNAASAGEFFTWPEDLLLLEGCPWSVLGTLNCPLITGKWLMFLLSPGNGVWGWYWMPCKCPSSLGFSPFT